MKKLFSKTLRTIFGMCMVALLSLPLQTHAQSGLTLPFGGLVLLSVPCTCSPVPSLWVQMAPYFPGQGVLPLGALLYLPGATTLYAHFNIGVPTSWHLGSYIPGPAACLIGIPPVCTALPAFGIMTQVGTSLPGGFAF